MDADKKAKGPKTYLYETLDGWEKQVGVLVVDCKNDEFSIENWRVLYKNRRRHW